MTSYDARYVDVSQAMWYAYGRLDAEPDRYTGVDPMTFGNAWADAKADRSRSWLPTIADAFTHYAHTGTIPATAASLHSTAPRPPRH